MLDHLPVIQPRLLLLRRLHRREVLALLLKIGELRLIEHIRPRARWAEIRVQTFSTPRGLDEQDGRVGELLHVEAEGELRADFLARRAEARRQFPRLLRLRAADGRNPNPLADLRLPIRAEHLREHRLRGRVHADVLERADLGVALHVRLPGEDEDLQRFCGLGEEAADRKRREGEEEVSHDLALRVDGGGPGSESQISANRSKAAFNGMKMGGGFATFKPSSFSASAPIAPPALPAESECSR